jgi:hypothetical protein
MNNWEELAMRRIEDLVEHGYRQKDADLRRFIFRIAKEFAEDVDKSQTRFLIAKIDR